jgi:transposase
MYPTDLTDRQWDCIKDLIPAAKPGGHPRTLDMRSVVNALLYLVVTGCQGRMLPREYPAWQSVYTYFGQWRDDGTWQRLHDTLRAQVRERAGRHKHPTAGALDSQSVKTTQVAGARGYESGKRVKGRKRHLLVDTLGMLLAVVVTTASLSDPAGARVLLKRLGEPARNCVVSGLMEPIVVFCWKGCCCTSSSSCNRYCALRIRKALSSYQGAGWWNAPSPGSLNADGSVRTMKRLLRAAKL